MKFLIPTAKEMNPASSQLAKTLTGKSLHIAQTLADYQPEQLAKFYKIKPEAALNESQRWQALIQQIAPVSPALSLFNGLMYRQLQPETIKDRQDFIKNHVFITSALYGLINGLEPISPHRLDFNCSLKIDGQSLKTFWRPDYDHFIGDELLVSLLSSEFETVFSPQVTKNFIKVSFHEEKNGQLKTHSTISKKGRGLFLNQVIEKEVQELEQLKRLQFAGFAYVANLSTAHHLVFVKKID